MLILNCIMLFRESGLKLFGIGLVYKMKGLLKHGERTDSLQYFDRDKKDEVIVYCKKRLR